MLGMPNKGKKRDIKTGSQCMEGAMKIAAALKCDIRNWKEFLETARRLEDGRIEGITRDTCASE
ncbi:MAG: hypothetical protein Crog4KO_36710 [Crocinitomicaceae bacterium]